ncbi:LysR family transcriptional regulator [Comamonas odontotermitis]|uniref:LysR family transcriptional regulator n=1 Tax=Comamonas odontotermitis TaxID=379895 RepID=UPI0037500D0A
MHRTAAVHTQLNRVQTFLAVVDFGSYTRAADFLGISKAMASLHVKALEKALSVTLLVRNTRAISLTETGQIFHDQFRGIFKDIDGAFENAMHRHNRVSGTLRISTTSEYGERYILPLLPEFVKTYPEITISYDVNSSLSDLLAEKLDLVVRLGSLPDSNFRSRKLSGYDIVLVASAEFLKIHPIDQPLDLNTVPWIANSNLPTPVSWTLRPMQSSADASKAVQKVAIHGVAAHASNSSTAIRAMALSSMGVAVLPAWMVADDLASGALTQILPPYALPRQAISVVYPNNPHVPHKTRVFIDFLCKHLH